MATPPKQLPQSILSVLFDGESPQSLDISRQFSNKELDFSHPSPEFGSQTNFANSGTPIAMRVNGMSTTQPTQLSAVSSIERIPVLLTGYAQDYEGTNNLQVSPLPQVLKRLDIQEETLFTLNTPLEQNILDYDLSCQSKLGARRRLSLGELTDLKREQASDSIIEDEHEKTKPVSSNEINMEWTFCTPPINANQKTCDFRANNGSQSNLLKRVASMVSCESIELSPNSHDHSAKTLSIQDLAHTKSYQGVKGNSTTEPSSHFRSTMVDISRISCNANSDNNNPKNRRLPHSDFYKGKKIPLQTQKALQFLRSKWKLQKMATQDSFISSMSPIHTPLTPMSNFVNEARHGGQRSELHDQHTTPTEVNAQNFGLSKPRQRSQSVPSSKKTSKSINERIFKEVQIVSGEGQGTKAMPDFAAHIADHLPVAQRRRYSDSCQSQKSKNLPAAGNISAHADYTDSTRASTRLDQPQASQGTNSDMQEGHLEGEKECCASKKLQNFAKPIHKSVQIDASHRRNWMHFKTK